MYVDLKLPKKVPPIPNPISVNTLPLPGYLEQTLATNLRMAMSAVGQERPKFPFIRTKRSALIFMGLHLKGYNPRSSQYERQKYQRKLQDYLDACNLPKWLAISMPLLFRSETGRSPSLTPRLNQFLGFQQFIDTASVWMEFTDDTREKQAAEGVCLQLKNPFDL
ncbi:unnamed protein product [Calicophoron daubneyi]|uniref:Uncharacterized protein n=1 Tax=Calicophoron daubneyi TaxID=300641 RepID=A0AAV2TIX3_CALDB